MKFPPQHGAWAFLIVPPLMVAFLGGANLRGLLFVIAWIAGYPVSYFLGRALIARIRRKAWTAKAKSELRWAGPWVAIFVITAAALVILRPSSIFLAPPVGFIWAVSVYLSWAGRERGIANDLLLAALAAIAPILMYYVATWHRPNAAIWMATFASMLFFCGSVIHVKSLIREASNPKWHRLNVLYHFVVFGGLLVFTRYRWLAIPFLLALIRSYLLKPGQRPGRLGAVEALVAVALVATVVLVNA